MSGQMIMMKMRVASCLSGGFMSDYSYRRSISVRERAALAIKLRNLNQNLFLAKRDRRANKQRVTDLEKQIREIAFQMEYGNGY